VANLGAPESFWDWKLSLLRLKTKAPVSFPTEALALFGAAVLPSRCDPEI